jgi:hypothetical protein
MARVNITIPDEVLRAAREAALNISRVATEALREELDRRAKIAELDAHLLELEQELGPIPAGEAADAAAWAERVLAPRRRTRRRSA